MAALGRIKHMDYGSDIQRDQREGKVREGSPQEGVLQWIQAALPSYWQARTGWVGRVWDRTVCFS